jgi:nitrite reductase/ring-hydroxylating ferredoxin subunit
MVLDAAHYVQGDAFQSEKRMVFAHAWLPIAAQPQLAKPGQFVAASLGGWPLLVTCGADGAARAFRNTCRHKNMLLVEQDAGTCANFRCRFHGWTYDLSGALADAPPAVAPAGGHAQHALTPVALRQWWQVMLVHLQLDTPAQDCTALDRALGRHDAHCTRYQGARMVDIAGNWKAVLEFALTDSSAIWQWPTLLLRVAGDLVAIDYIVPRSFLRTRVIRHVFAAGGTDDAAVQHTFAALDGLKAAAEQMHSERAQGKPAAWSNGQVAELHARLQAAYARDADIL